MRLQPRKRLSHGLRPHLDFGGKPGLHHGPFRVENFQRYDTRMGQAQDSKLFIPGMLDQSRCS
jgi:hypothetical protein